MKRKWSLLAAALFLFGLGFSSGARSSIQYRGVTIPSVALSYIAKEVVEFVDNDIIFSTEYWDVVLNEKQYYLGRATIRLKRFCQNWQCTTEAERLDFWRAYTLYEEAVRKALGAESLNLACLMNDGLDVASLIPSIEFLHCHVRPRFPYPIHFAGKTFVDWGFGGNFWRDVSEDVKLDYKERRLLIYKLRAELPAQLAYSQ